MTGEEGGLAARSQGHLEHNWSLLPMTTNPCERMKKKNIMFLYFFIRIYPLHSDQFFHPVHYNILRSFFFNLFVLSHSTLIVLGRLYLVEILIIRQLFLSSSQVEVTFHVTCFKTINRLLILLTRFVIVPLIPFSISSYSSFVTMKFYMIGLLTLCPTPNLEDQGVSFCQGHHLRPVWHWKPYQQLRYRQHSAADHNTQAPPLRQSRDNIGGTLFNLPKKH